MADYLSSPQVMALIHYLLQAGESADSEAFVRELAQRVPQHGDALMTIAQQLEQKGIEKGIQLGEQKGKLEVGVSLDIENYCTIRASPACQRRYSRFLSALQ
ncbi:putative transposase (plasmid) [Yersinia pestis Angola]|nr:putative transposase [Yersinia pestis Angola]